MSDSVNIWKVTRTNSLQVQMILKNVNLKFRFHVRLLS